MNEAIAPLLERLPGKDGGSSPGAAGPARRGPLQHVGRVPVRAERRARAGDPAGRYHESCRFVTGAGSGIDPFRTYTCTSSGCTVPPKTPFVKVMPEGRPEKSGCAGPDVPAGIGSENDFALVVDVFMTTTYRRPWYVQ